MTDTHDTYQSAFSWRYGSRAMRQIWSETNRRVMMRKVWLALALAQHKAGLVSAAQLADLQEHVDDVDIGRALVIEKEIHHDVMAEIRTFAEQCPKGGGIIHWGATSADITDNADVLRQREAARLLVDRLQALLSAFAGRIEDTACLPVMAYTHIQPAEPTTLGYRLATYAQDLLADLQAIKEVATGLRGKGLKGAVGSQASFAELLKGTDMSPAEMEAEAMTFLDLPAYAITTQTYPRRQDLTLLNVLAGLAATLHKFALDFRLMQSPAIGEWAEPFARKQVGSSAMPFKRNPILSENICSLARYVAALPAVAWENTAQAVLERSLDDSANRRLFLPEAFLALEEMLLKAGRLVDGMVINEAAIERNLARYGPFAATERVLMALVAAGAGRQEAHEWIRQASLEAWPAVEQGRGNPLAELLAADPNITPFLSPDQVHLLMDAVDYIGTAGERAAAFAQTLREIE